MVSSSGAGIQAGAGSGASAGDAVAGSVSDHGAGSIANGQTGGKFSSSKAAGSFSRSSASFTVSHQQLTTGGGHSTELTTAAEEQKLAAHAKRLNDLINKAATTTTANSTPTSTTTGSPTPPSTTTGAPPPTQTVATTKVVVRTKIKTVVHNHTITRTITKTVAPKLPVGAFMPSRHPELGLHSFTITGMNIGCVLARTGVRCGIAHRDWTTPKLPSSCRAKPESTLALAGRGLPKFSCGGSNPIHPGANVMPSGWDTTVGDYTCQVRSFAVDCFNSKSRSGFTIGRTGYSLY